MERKDMQQVVGTALTLALESAEVVLDDDHGRRLVRCLLRGAARVLLDQHPKMPPEALAMNMAKLAASLAMEEAQSKTPSPCPKVLPCSACTETKTAVAAGDENEDEQEEDDADLDLN